MNGLAECLIILDEKQIEESWVAVRGRGGCYFGAHGDYRYIRRQLKPHERITKV